MVIVLVLSALGAALAGCQNQVPTPSVILYLPNLLHEETGLRKNFQSKVKTLEVEVEEQGTPVWRQQFAPDQWSEVWIPREILENEKAQMHVRVWDVTSSGQDREYPALEGEASLGTFPVSIYLRLRVPLSEYHST
ncbi:hypothetical protein EBQ90_04630 [bacterium]|nr:hypothetical protein [bacterium]